MKLKTIPQFPIFAEPNLDMLNEVDPLLKNLQEGASEFSFLNLYLFRHTYQYSFASFDDMLIIKGSYEGMPFVMSPCKTFFPEIIKKLMDEGVWWTCITDEFLKEHRTLIRCSSLRDFTIAEDRKNFDYIYLSKSLATLEGKDLHKKKTHINKFKKTYPNFKVEPLSSYNANSALTVLQQWIDKKDRKADFEEAEEVLTFLDDKRFNIKGVLLYVEDVPIAWSLAEIIKERDTAVILFEKALDEYKGSFQYINYELAKFLSDDVKYINREQDLGDEGLRQAKMTYKPVTLLRKYASHKSLPIHIPSFEQPFAQL